MHPLYNNKIVHTKQITALIISFLFASDETGSVSFTCYWWTDSWNTISISQHTTSSLCLCYSTKNTTLWNGTVKYKHKHNSLPWILQSNLATRPSSLLLTSKSESSNNLKQKFGCNCLQGSVWACTRKRLVLWLNGCVLSATGLARWIKVCRWPEALTCSSAQWVCAHEQGVPILKGGHRVISFPLQDWLVVFFGFVFVFSWKCSNAQTHHHPQHEQYTAVQMQLSALSSTPAKCSLSGVKSTILNPIRLLLKLSGAYCQRAKFHVAEKRLTLAVKFNYWCKWREKGQQYREKNDSVCR